MEERRRAVTDARALSALAHPVRVALLNHLMTFGPATATACAPVAGATPSNCSYHLRYLARHGFVEPVEPGDGSEPGDGRERTWRSAATGFELGDSEAVIADPTMLAAEQVVAGLRIDEAARVAHRYIRAGERTPAEWRRAGTVAGYGLLTTAGELAALVDAIDALIRPYIALTRDDAPNEARPVHVSVQAFLHPDAAP